MKAADAPGRTRVALTVALLCLIWGTTWSVIAVGLRGIPPFSGVSIRFAAAGLVLLAVARIRRVPIGSSRRELALWAVNGLLAFCVSYGITYWSEQWLPSGLTSVLFSTYPLFVALLAHFLLPDETLGSREILGTLVGFGGVGVIFSADFTLLGGSRVALAAAVMLCSPLAAATASVCIKRWGRGIHTFSLNAVPMLLAGVLMGVVAVALERDARFVFDASSVGSLAYLAIAGTAVTFSLYYWLLSHLPAKRVALIAYVIPVVAMFIGVLLGEPLTPRTLGGSACVVAGVALAVGSRS